VSDLDTFTVSDESHELAWVSVEDVDAFSKEWSVQRMAEKTRYRQT
jgi:hypothetical protein